MLVVCVAPIYKGCLIFEEITFKVVDNQVLMDPATSVTSKNQILKAPE